MPELALLSEYDVRDPAELSPSPVTTGRDGNPWWIESFVNRLATLRDLEPGWDSYGAPALRVEAVYAAFELLTLLADDSTPAPQVVPTCHGGVQLEWHERGIDLEIEVNSPFSFNVFYENAHTGEMREEEILSDLTPLGHWIKSLVE